MGIGIGFIFLYVLLPILLIYIVITELGTGLKRILWTFFLVIFYILELCFDLVTYIIRAIES